MPIGKRRTTTNLAPHGSTRERKKKLRAKAERIRRALPDKETRSRRITASIKGLEAYRRSRTVMWYLGLAHEVHTWEAVEQELETEKRVVVPYCREHELGLFDLRHMEEVAEGAYGLFEPLPGLRGHEDRVVPPEELEAVVVPGVMFDARGGRLGHGARYYDRLLAELPPSTARIGVAFACQVTEEVPMETHDQWLDWLVTEEAVYRTARGSR